MMQKLHCTAAADVQQQHSATSSAEMLCWWCAVDQLYRVISEHSLVEEQQC